MKPSPSGRHVAASIVALLLSACTSSVSPLVPSQTAPGVSAGPSPLVVVIPPRSPDLEVEPQPSGEPSPEPTTVAPGPSEDLSGSEGPGCGTGARGFFAHRSEVPGVLLFGGATIEFTTAVIEMRNGTYGGEDAIPGGIGLTANEIAVRVDPGTHVLLRGDRLTLTDVTARVSPWGSVDFGAALASWPDRGDRLVWRPRPDGSISVSAPSAPGDYVVEFLPRWRSACLQGDGTAYSRIKVNG